MNKAYDIEPATSVGPFNLGPSYLYCLSPAHGLTMSAGDSLWHVLGTLRARKVEYPKVELAWDPEASEVLRPLRSY